MIYQLKQKILKKIYNKAKNIYIVCRWAKWAVLPARFYKFDKKGYPLTIYFTDHNGMFEEYSIVHWHNETSGVCLAYFFNEAEAQQVAYFLNKKEERT